MQVTFSREDANLPLHKTVRFEAKVWHDHLALGNAFARVFRYGVQCMGKLYPMPDMLWKAAMSTYFFAAVRIPVTSYFLVEEIRRTANTEWRLALRPLSKAANRLGALTAQCFQMIKGLKAFWGVNPWIPIVAVQTLGALGLIFAVVGIRSHVIAGIESWRKTDISYRYEFKAAAHGLSACSIALNALAVTILLMTGFAAMGYLLLGTSALLSTLKYGVIKPQMGYLRYL